MTKIWQDVIISIETDSDHKLRLDFIDLGRGYYAIPINSEGGVINITKSDNVKITMPALPDIPPLPTSARYKVILPNGLNVRALPDAHSKDIGDLFTTQIVEIDNNTVQGTRYLWGKLLSIETPTAGQVAMMQLEGEKWVAMQDGSSVWLEVVAEA